MSTGNEQCFIVPAGVSALHVVTVGGAGGESLGGFGGAGAQVMADIAVTPGSTLYVEVGGGGGSATNQAAGGGGAADVRTCPVATCSLAVNDARVVVAGGGGGAGGGGAGGSAGNAGNGGAGASITCQPGAGGVAGASGTPGGGAAGGTCIAGGTGGSGGVAGSPGALGAGGSGGAGAGADVGGGGGGGYYGGGGGGSSNGAGSGGGGAGGSSFGPAGQSVGKGEWISFRERLGVMSNFVGTGAGAGGIRFPSVETSTAETNGRPAWVEARIPRWGDNAWWQAQIEDAVCGGDLVICNLKITLAHQELSLALRHITGPASGANFHTWAVWGSKKAGHTIRREELPILKSAAWALGSMLGASTSVAVSRGRRRCRPTLSIAVGSAAVATLQLTVRMLAARARREIFGGNVTVLTDIGRETGRFVSTFLRPEDRTEERLKEFLAQLRPGHIANGGQDLLSGAYRHYYLAAGETDPGRRDQRMLYANLLAILHEHHRLDPYIDASVPRPLRRLVTTHLLGFTVGTETLKVSRDVPRVRSRRFPETLREIDTPELADFLFGTEGWDRTPDTLTGSAARDWTELEDRMHFIVDLFRSRQSEPVLFTPPYSDEQRAMILAGHVPRGPL